jgi:hypothetical protein
LTTLATSDGRFLLRRANAADDADLRRLLRENPMGGWIQLAFAREPSAFAADFGLSCSHGFVIAHERDSAAVVGACEQTTWQMYVDGVLRRVPYLGVLRVAPQYRHRIRVLKGGFAAVRQFLFDERDVPFALTAIVRENHVARRILTQNLAGLPHYRPLAEITTLALRPCRLGIDARVERATAADLPEIAKLVDQHARRQQFGLPWSTSAQTSQAWPDQPPVESFLVVRDAGQIAACVALWDQTATKQTFVAGYAGWLRYARPLANIVAPLTGAPTLPPAGQPLKQAYISFFAFEPHAEWAMVPLLRSAIQLAHDRRHAVVLLGTQPNSTIAQAVRALTRAREYDSTLYTVHWPEEPRQLDFDRGQTPAVEIALL